MDGRTAAVLLLLQHGADDTLLDKNGKTALQLAAEKGNTAIAEIMRDFADQRRGEILHSQTSAEGSAPTTGASLAALEPDSVLSAQASFQLLRQNSGQHPTAVAVIGDIEDQIRKAKAQSEIDLLAEQLEKAYSEVLTGVVSATSPDDVNTAGSSHEMLRERYKWRQAGLAEQDSVVTSVVDAMRLVKRYTNELHKVSVTLEEETVLNGDDEAEGEGSTKIGEP